MLLLGFNYDLSRSFLLFQFPSALDSDAKSEKQPKTNPAPQTYPAFSDEKPPQKAKKTTRIQKHQPNPQKNRRRQILSTHSQLTFSEGIFMAEAEEHSGLNVALSQLKLASKKLQLDSGMYKMLSLPKRSISVSIDIRMDNGGVGVFNGLRVQHWDARGPFKGGIRYSPGITHRRSHRTRDANDVEMRHRQPPIRRSKRRNLRRHQKTHPTRNRTINTQVRQPNLDYLGPHTRYSSTRHVH